jgi:hypothetical protein
MRERERVSKKQKMNERMRPNKRCTKDKKDDKKDVEKWGCGTGEFYLSMS